MAQSQKPRPEQRYTVTGQQTMSNSEAVVIASDQPALPVVGAQPTLATASWTSATGLNTVLQMTITSYATVTFGIVTPSGITGGVVSFEASFDGTNWFSIQAARLDGYAAEVSYALVGSVNKSWSTSVDAFNYFRVRLSSTIVGAATVLVAISAQTQAIEPIVVVGQSTGALLQTNSQLVPSTTGGLSVYHLVSAASTNATVVKGAAGQLYGWYIYNNNATARKVIFHNAAATPTAGANVFFSLMIPPNSGANVFSDTGISFSTGIAITTTTGVADTDAAAVAANDLIINLFYK